VAETAETDVTPTASFRQDEPTMNRVIEALMQMREEEPRRLQEAAAAAAKAAAEAKACGTCK
jgi:CHASE3 domain sensor protein